MNKALRFNSSMPDKEQIQILITGSIMAFAASFLASLMRKEKSTWDHIRFFLAGTILGVLAQAILLDSSLAPLWKNIIACGLSAGITKVWPVFETHIGLFVAWVFAKYLKKNGDDTIQDNKPS